MTISGCTTQQYVDSKAVCYLQSVANFRCIFQINLAYMPTPDLQASFVSSFLHGAFSENTLIVVAVVITGAIEITTLK